MMKANELSHKDLMIGDYVMINPISYYQVEQIRVEFDEPRIYLKGTEVFATESEIMPIPLTPEILKKNGFEYYHKNFASLSYDHQFKLKMEKWPDENGLGGLWSIIDLIKIRYVHELQQAMRMCSIEKEIIL